MIASFPGFLVSRTVAVWISEVVKATKASRRIGKFAFTQAEISQQNIDHLKPPSYNVSIEVGEGNDGGIAMANMNEIISNNIMLAMKKQGKKQVDLSSYLGVSKQIISKMLSGARIINAVELQKIAEFLGVSMESLVEIPQIIPETNTVKAFMGKVESPEAKEGLQIADEIADMICFYTRTRENAENMMQPWEA